MKPKWKRKEWEEASTNTNTCSEKELTPLASCLLENFANGMSESCLHTPPHVHACKMSVAFFIAAIANLIQPRDHPSRL